MQLIEHLEERKLFANYTAATVAELIAHINAANNSSQADTITLAAGATFSLSVANDATNGPTGLPAVQAGGGQMSILGNGATIERSAVAGTPAFRVLDVAPGASLKLTNLILQGGSSHAGAVTFVAGTGYVTAEAQGGAVYNRGALTLTGVTIRNNTARGGDSWLIWNSFTPAGNAAGGGVFSTGTLSATGCTFENNLAVGGRGGDSRPYYRTMPGNGGSPTPPKPGGNASGGGIHVGAGSATIVSSTFTANTAQGGNGGSGNIYAAWTAGGSGGNGFGGALFAGGGTLTLRSVSATANNAPRGLGGISASGKPKAQPGKGTGGGLYLDVAASAGLDSFTVNHVKQNTASNTSNNIAGAYRLIA